jgi:hypothetical protein
LNDVTAIEIISGNEAVGYETWFLDSGQDFEVQIRQNDNGKSISYWAKQSRIDEFLENIKQFKSKEYYSSIFLN